MLPFFMDSIIWFAGLFEGEGCFYLDDDGKKKKQPASLGIFGSLLKPNKKGQQQEQRRRGRTSIAATAADQAGGRLARPLRGDLPDDGRG